MNPLDLLNPYRWLLLGGLALAVGFGVPILWHRHNAGQQEIGYDRAQGEYRDAADREREAKAREGLRRLEQQQENQRDQDQKLAAARADAERNRADADRVREQSADAARQWAARLADSPAAGDLAAASAAIAVCTDVRSRMDDAAGQLAAYADAAREAGNKCAADYQALTVKP